MPRLRQLIAFALAAALSGISEPLFATGLADSLAGFANDSFADTVDALNAVAASGDPRAATIVEALRDGRLVFDPATKTVFYRDAAGTLSDAATGTAVSTPPADLSAVRLNNRVRGALQAALGSLTLMAPDAATRRSAAAAVFKSRDASALPTLDAAIAKEADPAIKRALNEARAAILIGSESASLDQKIEAVAVISARGDRDALAILSAIADDAPAELRDASKGAIAAINGQLALWAAAQNAWYGLSLGSVLLLAAIGLAITFGVMGIINMAHGEMVMLGAYTTFVVQEVIRAHAPWLFEWSLAIAIPLAFLFTGTIGILIERGVIRWLYGRPLETLLATFGLSLILQQSVRTIFGPTNREVGSPRWMSGGFEVGHLAVTFNRLWIIVFATLVFVALLVVMKRTAFGLRMRAVTANRAMAGAIGIRTPLIDALTFAVGSGIAGVAGVALSQIDNVSPNLGQGYIIDSFMVVVFGGVGNLFGTLIGALTLGVANKVLEPFAGAVLGKILILGLIILFIQKRPRGLFALRGRSVEA
ncbi:MAG: urea ABC transporter permease subunit UrtB [Bauldia sp.]